MRTVVNGFLIFLGCFAIISGEFFLGIVLILCGIFLASIM